MSRSSFGRFDGHYWVERNGKIIDIDFPEYQLIKAMKGCKGKCQYKEAPIDVQKVFIKSIKTEELENGMKRNIPPSFNRCQYNAYMEQKLHGGRIVFGSMGWKMKNGKVWWEYGGENWTKVVQFVKK
jgi:hypothetical protein